MNTSENTPSSKQSHTSPSFEDNVLTQFQHNALHSDGTVSSFAEEAKSYMEDFAKRIKTWVGPNADPSLLDAGCRLGYTLPVYIEQFPASRVVGLDIVPQFVEFAGKESETIEGDICALPFEDEEFDFTFCCQTLEHALDPSLAAKELLRVTRQGLFVSIPLESAASFDGNPSHNLQSENPLDWLALFNDPDWVLYWASAEQTEQHQGAPYFNFILRKKQKHELAV